MNHKIVSTAAGTTRVRVDTERRFSLPSGERVKLVTRPEGGTQVEHGEHLHAHVVANGASTATQSFGSGRVD